MNRFVKAACVAAIVLFAAPAFAQTYTWTATTSGNWNTAGNWSGGAAAVSSSATSLYFGGSTTLTASNNISNSFLFNSLNFTNTAGTMMIGGDTLSFVSTGSTTPTINMTGAGTGVLSNSFTVSNALTITSNAGAGPLWLAPTNNGGADTVYGSQNVTIYNNSSNTVWIPDMGGWTGNLYVNSGYVEAANTGGDLFSNTTVLNVAAGATFNFNSNAESMGGIAGAGTINGNADITFYETGSRTFSGSIQGTALVTQDIGSTLVLTGTNTNTGGFTVSIGTIQIANANAVPDSTVTVSVTNGLTFNTDGGTIAAFNLGGLSGASNFSLTDINGYAANISVGANNATTTYSGVLSGSGGVTKVGTGTLTLTGNNTYTGPTTISGGVIQALSDAAFGAVPASYVPNQLTLNGGVLKNDNSVLTISANRGITLGSAGGYIRPGWTDPLTVNSVVTGSGALSICNDSGTVVLSNTGNNFSGVLTIGNTANGTGTVASLTVMNLANGGVLSCIGSSSNSAANLVFSAGSTGTSTLVYAGGGDSTDRLFTLASNAVIDASGTGALSFTNSGAIVFSGTPGYTLTLGGTYAGLNFLAATLVNNGTKATTLDVNGAAWTLSNAANTYSGGTNLSGGTLNVTADPTLGNGGVTFSGNSTLQAGVGALSLNATRSLTINSGVTATIDTQGYAMTIAGAIGGTGGLTKVGTGTLTLAAANTYTGTTVVSNGTISIGNALALQNSTLGDGTDYGLTFASGVTSATLGGLSGTNPYVLQNAGGGAVALSVGNNGASTTFSGNLMGSGQLTKIGGGLLYLSGSSSYAGGTTLSGGNLEFATTAAIPSSGSLTINAGGALVASGAYPTVSSWLASGLVPAGASGAITLTPANSDTGVDFTTGPGFSGLSLGALGAVTYGGTLTPAAATYRLGGGGGTLTLTTSLTGGNSLVAGSGSGGDLVLAATNNYTGNTTITAGTLQQGIAGAIPAGPGYGNVVLSGGALDLMGINLTVNELSGTTGTVLNSSGTNTLTVGNTNATSTFAGVLANGAGVLALAKTGAGMLTLAGANTYTGGTIVSGGTLLLASNGVKTLPASAVATVNAGGVLAIVGTTTGTSALNISNTINVNSGGTLMVDQIGTGALQDQESYIGTVNLDSSLGTGAVVTSPNATGLRMGYNGSSFLNSTGSVANTWAAELRLVYKSGDTATITTGPGNTLIISGVMDDYSTYPGTPLYISGGGTLQLTGANTIADPVTIRGGTVLAAGNSPLGTGSVTLSPSSAATLLFTGATPVIGALGSGTAGGISTVLLGDPVGNNPTTLTINSLTSTTFNGAIGDQSGTASAAVGSLVKLGTGTLTLGGSNTYTGNTTIGGGALQLDFNQPGAPAANILSPASSVMLTYGTVFRILGANTGNSSQTFAAMNVNAGPSALQATPGSGYTLAVALGALNRSPGGTVDFPLPANAAISTTSGTASTLLTDAYGVAYATVAGANWAAKDATNQYIVPGSQVTGFYTSTTSGTLSGNADVASNTDTTLSANTAISSLRFNQNQGRTINLNGDTLTTGGIFVTPNVATAGSNIAGGTLYGPAGGDLVVIQNGSQPFTISSTIADNGCSTALNKSGSGNLVLAGANTYSGNTNIWSGSLTLANANALANSLLNYSGLGGSLSFGTLTSASFGGLSGSQSLALQNTSSAAVALTVGSDNQSTTYSGVLSGSGGLTMNGNGMLTLAGNNTYSGGTTISGGTLNFTAAANLGASSATISFQNGGTLLYSNSASLNVGASNPLKFVGGGTVDVSNSAAYLCFYPTFSGAGTLTKTGPGQLCFESSGSGPTGPMVIAQGSFMQTSEHIASVTALTVQNGGQYEIFDDQDYDTGQSANFSIASAGTITLNGKGPIGSGGALLYTPQSDQQGVALVTNNIQLQTDSSVVVCDATQATNPVYYVYKLRLNGNISGPGGLIKDYLDTLPAGRSGEMSYFADSMGILALGGTNSYQGNTTINSGTILCQSNSSLPATTTVYIDALHKSTLDLGGYNATIAGLYNGPNGGGTITNSGTAAASTLTVSGGGLFGGLIQDGSSKTTALALTGGMLTLTGSNSFSGGATVSGGTLLLNNANAVENSIVNLGSANGVAFGGGIGAFNFGGLAGAGAMALTDTAGNPVALTVGGNVVAANFTGSLSGGGSLTKIGSGVQALGGINSYTGVTTINSGYLQAASDAALGAVLASYVANQITLNGGGLMNDGASTAISANRGITLGPAGGYLRCGGSGTQSLTINSLVTGSGPLTIANDLGTVTLANTANNYNGVTTIGNVANGNTNGAAALIMPSLPNGGVPSPIGSSTNSAANLVFNAGVGGTGILTYNGNGDSTDRLFTLASNAAINASGTGPLSFTNTGAIAFSGSLPCTLTLAGSGLGLNTFAPALGNNGVLPTSLAVNGALWTLTGSNNTYTGGTVLSGGTLLMQNAQMLQNSTLVTTPSGNLAFAAGVTSPVLGGLAGSGNLVLQDAASNPVALTVGANNASTFYSGALSGGNGLTKTGSGVLTIAAPQNYAGPTVIQSGTLQLGPGSLSGFGGANATGWTLNHTGTGAAISVTSGNVATLITNPNLATGNSMFCNTEVPVVGVPWTATFTYNDVTGGGADGGAFVLETSPSAASAMGSAYSNKGVYGITPSAEIVWNIYASNGTSKVDYLTGGGYTPTLSTTASGVNITTANTPTNFTVSFNGASTLTLTLSQNGHTWSNTYTGVNLAAALGGAPGTPGPAAGLAYVGFTGGDGGVSATQQVSNFNITYGSLTPNVLPVNTPVQVNAGGTLDLDGNVQAVGSLSGAGTVTNSVPAAAALTVGNDGTSQTFSGAIGGNLSLTKIGGGMQTLSGSNSYSGGAKVSGGVLQVGSAAALGTGGLAANGGTLDLAGYSVTVPSFSGAAGTVTNNGAANSQLTVNQAGATVFGGTICNGPTNNVALALTGGLLTLTGSNTYSGGTTVSGGTLQLGNGGSTGSLPIAGSLVDNGVLAFHRSNGAVQGTDFPVVGGSGALVQLGTGVLSLNAANTYSGNTTVSAGTLQLDFTQNTSPTANILPANTNLLLGANTGLQVLGAAGVANSQTVAGMTINPGTAEVQAVSGTGGTLTLALGAVNRASGGMVDFRLPAAGGISTTSGSASTILTDTNGVAYATVAGSDWAAMDANNQYIEAGSSVAGFYTPTTASVLSGNADVASGVDITLAASTTVSSLRFNVNEGRTINLGGNTLTTGGVLVTPNVATAGSNITGGALTAPAGGDLVVIQNSGQDFTISATIADNGASVPLNKYGPGNLVLGGANNYTGNTTIWGGTLTLANSGALAGSTLNYNFQGGALGFGTLAAATFGGLSGGQGLTLQNVSSAAVALSVGGNGQNGTYSGVFSDGGSGGSLNKIGTGTLTLTAANTYTGTTVVSGGTLALANPNALAQSTLYYNNQGGALSFGTLTSATLGGLSGGQSIALQNASAAALALTVGGNNQATTYSGVLSGNGGLTVADIGGLTLTGNNTFTGGLIVNAGGTVTLTGNNTYLGGTVISGGTVNFTGAASLGASAGAVSFQNGGTLLYSGADANFGANYPFNFLGNGTVAVSNSAAYLEVYPTYSGTGTLTKTGLGQYWLSSSGVGPTGPIVVAQGCLMETSQHTASVTALTVENGAQWEIMDNVNNDAGGGANFSMASTATIALNGMGQVGSGGAILYTPQSNAQGVALVTNNIVLQTNSSVVVADAASYTYKLRLNGNISGTGGLVKDYLSAVPGGRAGEASYFTNSMGILALGGTNTYTGNTTINSGTILCQSNFALPATTTVAVDALNGSTLDLGGYNATIAGLTNGPNGGGTITNSGSAASTLTVNQTGASTFSGSLTDGSSNKLALAMTGSGMLTLSGVSNYTGGTQVSGGTLQLGSNSALGAGSLTANAGVIDLAGNSPTVGSLAGAAGLITVSGTSNSTLTVNQTATMVFGGSLNDGSAAHLGLVKNGGGTLVLTGTSAMGIHTDVNLGVLQVDGALSVPSLNVNGTAQLAGAGTVTITSDSVYFQGTAASTFAGTFAGPGAVEVDSGSLTLTGSSTYSGGTSLVGGILVIANSAGSATGPGAVMLYGGVLAGSAAGGAISGPVQAENGPHTIAPGAGLPSGQYGILHLNGGLTTNNDTTLSFNLGSPVSGGIYNGDLITIGSGGLSIGASTAFDFASNPSTLGDYRLFGGNISGAATGNFVLPTAPGGDNYSLSTSVDSGYLDLVVSATATGGGTSSVSGGTASWNSNIWSGASSPSSGTVTLGGSLSAPVTITLDGNQSAGALVFNASGSNGYTIAQGTGGTLTLGTAGGAAVTVLGGTHDVSAPIDLAGNLTVSMTGGGSLQLGNLSDPSPASLSLSGDGQLILSGSDSYTGGTNVLGGTLIATSNAAIVDGTSLAVGAGGTFVFDPMAGGSPDAIASGEASRVAAVPEPGTIALLLVALGSAVACHRFAKRLPPPQTKPCAF